MQSPGALPIASLVLGLVALVVFAVGVQAARGEGLMGLGLFALGLFAAAALGLAGLIVGILALRRSPDGRGLAIAGVVLSSAPIVLLAVVMLFARSERRNEPIEEPMKPPTPVTDE